MKDTLEHDIAPWEAVSALFKSGYSKVNGKSPRFRSRLCKDGLEGVICDRAMNRPVRRT